MRWAVISLTCLTGALALTPAQWRSQSIYQVLTDRYALANLSTTVPCPLSSYCGGTWQGLINGLDYIEDMGFTAVWISPVVANIDVVTGYGWSYHGYWQQDLYALNEHFGTADDLKALSTALHARGMSLMVDVVANHMAYPGAPDTVDYAVLQPFDSESWYYPYCPINYTNATSTQDCWEGDTIVSLPQIRTDNPTVQTTFNKWIADLVSNYSIDGLRIDSALEIDSAFFPPFVAASDVYAVGEVFDGDPSVICSYERYLPGVLNYAAYYWIQRAFTSSNTTMTELADGIQALASQCNDTTLLGNFIENHDNPRFASLTNDSSLTKNAIAYSFLSDGIPIVYYGQEQGMTGLADPDNRQALWPTNYNNSSPLYTYIQKLNLLRSRVMDLDPSYVTTVSTVAYLDQTTLATAKGGTGKKLVSVFTNTGSGVDSTITLPQSATGWSPDTIITDLLSCQTFQTDSSGDLMVQISNGLPLALYNSTNVTLGKITCTFALNSVTSSATSASSGFANATISIGSSSISAMPTSSLQETPVSISTIYVARTNGSACAASRAPVATASQPLANYTGLSYTALDEK